MITQRKPASHDELEALIREARERQLRRRLLAAAGVAIGAAVGLSAYALTISSGAHARTNGGTSAGVPLCRASQLSASFGTGGAAGTTLGGLVIGNAAAGVCSLPIGRPTVSVIYGGERLPTKERSWGSGQTFGSTAGPILRRGARAFFEIGWRSWCPNPAAAPQSRQATLIARFRGGFRLVVPDTPPDRFVGLPGCGEAVHPTPWIAVSRLLRFR